MQKETTTRSKFGEEESPKVRNIPDKAGVYEREIINNTVTVENSNNGSKI